MLNKSRDELAYNLIDIDTRPEPPVLEKMWALDGVINARLIGDDSSPIDY
jgi:D-3-phosphoglycerate dehydrogenase